MTKRIASLTDIQNWIEEFICTDWNNLFPRVNRIFAEHVTIAGPIASIKSSIELTGLLEQEGGEVTEDIWNDIVAMGITDRPTVVYEDEGVYIVDIPVRKLPVAEPAEESPTYEFLGTEIQAVKSPEDDVVVIHIDTPGVGENEHGPLTRVYLNDEVIYENPIYPGRTDAGDLPLNMQEWKDEMAEGVSDE